MRILSNYVDQEILIIGEGFTIDAQGEPFTGASGDLLRASLSGFPSHLFGYVEIVRTEYEEDLSTYRAEFVRRLFNVFPCKKIIVLGGGTAKLVLPESFTRGHGAAKLNSLPPVLVNDKTVACTYHPKYIARQSDAEVFQDYVDRLKEIIEDTVEEYKLKWHILPLKEIFNLARMMDKNPVEQYGFDYETNGSNPMTPRMYPTGFSLAKRIDQTSGVAWHFYITDEDRKNSRLLEGLALFLKKNESRLWCYNAKFEMEVTWAWLGKLCFFQDAMVLCIQDHSQGSLKNNSRKFVRASLWEEKVNIALDSYSDFFSACTKAFKEPEKLPGPDNIVEFLEGMHDYPSAVRTTYFNLIDLYGAEEVARGIAHYPYHWAAVPSEVLGEYCNYDAYYTILLKDHLWPMYHESYEIYISNMHLSAVMEGYGVNWDDKEAEVLADRYLKDACKTLVDLIQHLEIPMEEKMRAREILAWKLPHTYTRYTPTGKPREEVVVNDAQRLDRIKGIFNPASNIASTREKFWNIYLTEEIKVITFLYAIDQEIHIRGIYDSVADCIDFSNPSEMITQLTSYDRDKSVEKIINEIIVECSQNYESMYTGKFSAGIFTAQYEILTKYCGVKITDPETWNLQFKMLYLLRKYKKMEKSRTTYINGSVGRDNLYRSEVGTSLSTLPRRISHYHSSPSKVLAENERWILNTEFRALSADTKRWRSSQHCLVGSTLIRAVDGSSRTIEDIYNNPSAFRTLTVREGTVDMYSDDVLEVRLSHFASTLIELELENGKVIQCTPNHRFLTTSGEYVEAQDISEETDLQELPSGYTVYRLENMKTGLSYVGMTTDVYKRYHDHMRGGKFSSVPTGDYRLFILKTGIELKSDALDIEESFIRKFDTVENGYNRCYRQGWSHVTKTESWRKAQSRAKTGNKNPQHGKNWTEQQMRKQREAHSGPRNAMYGKQVPEDTKDKIRASRKNTEASIRAEGRTICGKLSDDDVRQLRELRNILKFTFKRLGEIFGVSRTTASQSYHGQYYGDVA